MTRLEVSNCDTSRTCSLDIPPAPLDALPRMHHHDCGWSSLCHVTKTVCSYTTERPEINDRFQLLKKYSTNTKTAVYLAQSHDRAERVVLKILAPAFCKSDGEASAAQIAETARFRREFERLHQARRAVYSFRGACYIILCVMLWLR